MKHYVPFARLERVREQFDAPLDFKPNGAFGRATIGEITGLRPARPPERGLTPIRRGYSAAPDSLDQIQQWGASHARAHQRFTDRRISESVAAREEQQRILAHPEKRAPVPFGQTSATVTATLAEYAAHIERVIQSDPVLGLTDDQIIEEMLRQQKELLNEHE